MADWQVLKMSRIWTPAQQNAIDSRKGTVLVSAAAGSGKTAVLVQRVIERLTDKQNPTPVENLLVVTFTKAAAAEMRERLSSTLAELIEKNPADSFLKRQRTFLPNASICTMDSFCSRLVKENFQNLNILPDFTMMSDNEHKLLKNDVVSEILDEVYADKTGKYSALLQIFTDGRSDKSLSQAILSIYDFAMASPYPKRWIEEHFALYEQDIPVEESIWGKYTLATLKENLEYLNVKIDKLFLDAGDEGKLATAVRNDLSPIQVQIKKCLTLIEQGDNWNNIKDIVDNLKLGKFERFSADEKDSLYDEIKERRDFLKDDSGDFAKLRKIIGCRAEDFENDTRLLRPVMSAFKECVLNFSDRLLQYKSEKNDYYFSDILHMALQLLVVPDENGVMQRSQLALELSDNFDEILIDEFQDTNEAQNFLFDAISKNSKNKFMVGDVKQSIYRFRQANPDIFVRYKDLFQDFMGDNYPAKISLDRNFRSRKGIVDSVNFFFDSLMTKKIGDVDYKNGDQLVFGADYYNETDNADTTVHIVEAEDYNSSNLKNEARYIAKLIKDTVESGMLVGAQDAQRPIRYGDICILMRSVQKTAPIVSRELTAMGVPVYYKRDGGFFEHAEIRTMLSLLRVIDNPVQDVPLVATMLSPLFPFSEDDLAVMRTNNRYSSIYTLLKENYDTNEKVKYFLDTVNTLRTLSVTLSVSGLIRRIFEMTAYDSVVGAMAEGKKRALNLQMLISYADTYEQNGHYGLSGFLRFVDRLQENEFDLESANTVTEADDVVRIMTIHKSKGLEFPVVILANCSGKFIEDHTEKAVVDKAMGVATVLYDSILNKEYETQNFTALKLKNNIEEMSEEIRVLYVAMTRAKEKLHIVGSMYKPYDSIFKLYCKRYNGQENNAVAIANCNSFFQWIILSMLSHPSLQAYAKSIGILNSHSVPTESKIGFVISEAPEISEGEERPEEKPVFDNDALSEIIEKVEFVYPFAKLSNTSIKYSASKIEGEQSTQYIATENPAFMGEDELTPAQRGTLSHRFMERCDFEKAERDVAAEILRLKNERVFNETESKAINTKQVAEFFNSPLYGRIKANIENFHREKEFTMSVPVCDLVPELECSIGETAVVQGIMDGIIINGTEGEIIDYKTDRVKDEDELVERYKAQMAVYKRAAMECFGLENVKVTLYSFSLSKEISVKV